jgi:hypothetical protein
MTTRSVFKYSIILISILLSWVIFLFLPDEALDNLTEEDHFIEWAGTLCMLAASIIFFITFLKDKKGNDFYFFNTKKNLFFLLLAILFFFGFGEELSWGQRIFNVQSPELIKEINVQGETNIHNLSIFSGLLDFNRLFNYFWISFCLIVPVLNRKWSPAEKFFNKINLPIVPVWLGIFFLISYCIFLVFKYSMPHLLPYLSEVKETSLSSLFFIFSVVCLNKNHH